MPARTAAGFWRGKRVLVTGGDGFLASHLVERLLREEAVVTVTLRHLRPLKVSKLLFGPRARVPDVEITDLMDPVEVARICHRHAIDTVFHLAASAIVGDAAKSPWTTFDNNVRTTLNLLEACRVGKVERVLIASSDKAYGDHAEPGDPEGLPYRESHALRGLDAYSASKVCCDMIAHTYALQFQDSRVLVVRCCNIYGPGDLNFSRLIPRTSMRLLAKQAPAINAGNATVLREYMHVDDVVDAYLLLGSRLEAHFAQPKPKRGRSTYGWAAFNVGQNRLAGVPSLPPPPERGVLSVEQIIGRLQRIAGRRTQAETASNPPNVVEIPNQYLDATRLHDLGFRPKVGIDRGLRETFAWYRKHQDELMPLAMRYL